MFILKLDKVKLYNFRSFSNEQIINFDDLTVIIGNNSSGKTAALAALNIMFSLTSNDRILKRSDFHISKDLKPENMQNQNLYIEAVFSFDEVESEDGEKSPSIPLFYNNMLVDSPNGKPLLRVRLTGVWEKSSNIEGSIESKIEYIVCPENEEITDDNRVIAKRRDLDNIRMLYVPAVRDPSKQLKNVSGTMIHSILSTVRWSEKTKENIKNTIEQLNTHFISENGVSVLNESIHNQWMNYDSDERYSNAVLRFNSTDIESSMKNSEVFFSPTVTEKEYTVDEMGDGFRSLFYISMVNSILDVETKIVEEFEDTDIEDDERTFLHIPPVLTIVAIEEPENHIAPQLLGKLMLNLKSMAKKNNAQVIITSHSPAIVKRIDTENLRYFRMNKSEMSTVVKTISLPDRNSFAEQYKYIKEAVRAYPEVYFAEMVVLGEGDSEEIILPRYFEAYGEELDNLGISVVPLGGRYVNHFWRLLSDLDIPYITLLDLDREREGGGWGRIKYAIEQLIETGENKNEFLRLKDGSILTDENLKKMHTWDVNDLKNMDTWISVLEHYNVYYSSPLDIDFMMLESIDDKYIASLASNEGPRIDVVVGGKKHKIKIEKNKLDPYMREYWNHVNNDVKQTLKKEGGTGETYTQKQKELMLWYNYFFLNRGKPTTHMSVLSSMSNEELKNNTPEVITKIIKKTKVIIKGEGNA